MIPYIILAIEDDDDRAFAERLYVNYRRLMISEIQRITKNSWDTEDVMQSVIEKLINKLDTLRTLDRNHLVNYIITASRNTALSLLRERKRMPAYSLDEMGDSCAGYEDGFSQTVEDQFLLRLDEEMVRQAWQQLTPAVREILNAKYILKQSDDEIATNLGIKSSSVRMALTRARRAFRDKLYIHE